MSFNILPVPLILFLAMAGAAAAQGGHFAFGDMARSRDLPVEVTADNLDVDQGDGTAIFTGHVIIAQGEMRLSAPKVEIIYLKDRSGIKRLKASGGVTLVNGQDAAEATRADYDVESGIVRMYGNVLLVQGRNALSAERMTVDLRAGTARVSGRVKTVLPQGDKKP